MGYNLGMIRVENGTDLGRAIADLRDLAHEVMPESGNRNFRIGTGQDAVVSLRRRRRAGVEKLHVTLIDTRASDRGVGVNSHAATRLSVISAPGYGVGVSEATGFTEGAEDRLIEVRRDGTPRFRRETRLSEPPSDVRERYITQLGLLYSERQLDESMAALTLDRFARTSPEKEREDEMLQHFNSEVERVLNLNASQGSSWGFGLHGFFSFRLAYYFLYNSPNIPSLEGADRLFIRQFLIGNRAFPSNELRFFLSSGGRRSIGYNTERNGRLYSSGQLVPVEVGEELVEILHDIQ